MKLVLRHGPETHLSHPGKMDVGDEFTCHTLEAGRGIPAGIYNVVRSYSAQIEESIPTLRLGDRTVGFIYWRAGKRHIIPGDHGAVDLIVNTRKTYQRIVDALIDAEENWDESNTLEVVA